MASEDMASSDSSPPQAKQRLGSSEDLSGLPKDKGSMVYLIQLLYGMGILLPFNMIINCIDFDEEKMEGYYPASTYPFALQFLLFFGSLFYTVFKDRWISTDNQIIWGFAVQSVLLTAIPILANIGGSTGYWTVFLCLVIDGWFAGVVQGVVYSENAKLPGNYIGIFLTSQGLSGIFGNLIRYASLAIWPDSDFISVAFCYAFCVLNCLLCIPAQIYLKKNSYALFYQRQTKYEAIQVVDKVTTDSTLGVVEHLGTTISTIDDQKMLSRQNSDEEQQRGGGSCAVFMRKARKNFMATKGLLPALFSAFTITFIVFPAVVQDTKFRFMSSWANEDSYFVLITLTLFNVLDTVGRYAAGVSCMQLPRLWTLAFNYARAIFIATFLLIAFEVGPDWLFNSDWFKFLNLSLFAFTNGWLSSLCVIMAPDAVPQSERGDVGTLINPAIVGGILFGCILAIPMEQVIKLTPDGQASS